MNKEFSKNEQMSNLMQELKATKVAKEVARAMYEDDELSLEEYLKLSSQLTKEQHKLRLQMIVADNHSFPKAS